MSSFDELLKKPLPSAMFENGDSMDADLDKEIGKLSKEFEEGDDDDDVLGAVEELIGSNPDIYGGDNNNGTNIVEGCKTEDDDDDLEDLASELNVNGSISDEVPVDIDDEEEDLEPSDQEPEYDPEEEAEPLDSDEDQKADQLLAATATPILLENCCTVKEIANFTENGESEIAISEGLVLESDINQILAELSEVTSFTESTFASSTQKYKMTKKARFNQLYELSLQIEARAHHDPLYPKIQKAYKIERTIKKVWRKKYGNLAAKRAKGYLKKLMSSGSPTLKKAASSVIGK